MSSSVATTPLPQPALPALQQALARPGIALAVLFGSRATGRVGPRSDWDIGVVVDAGVDVDRLCAELEAVVGGRVDVVELRRAPPVLAMAIVRDGVVLVDVDGNGWPRFVSLALRRFEDTRKLRAAQDSALAVFLAERGHGRASP
jgi:predicted nucleotidyltransferase